MGDIIIRKYEESDLEAMIEIWNEVVSEGTAFPQEDCLGLQTGKIFFASQTYCGTAEDVTTGTVKGLYILHPNNVGRCGHISNASYAVKREFRNAHIGEKLVIDCISQAGKAGFKILQLNAVVENNASARHLYEKLGFKQLGVIPDGFRMPDGSYAAICPYYIETDIDLDK